MKRNSTDPDIRNVFIGGSRRISRLGPEVARRLDQVIERGMQVLVGDANGADKAVQAYFHERGYPRVRVFCSAGHCRNNVGRWPVESVRPPHANRDFAFFAAKDAAMSEAADAAIMLWDGESAGTIVNVARLAGVQKPVVLYHSRTKRFENVLSPADLAAVLAECDAATRVRLESYIAANVGAEVQESLFASGAMHG